jgi:CPA1 family monovalent cation:H+ antiporter
MRGVIALAAAVSLPETLDNGMPFPQRDVLIFLTFCVILFTLVAQGLSLPFLIRKLGLAATPASIGEEHDTRQKMLMAAVNQIHALRNQGDAADDEMLADLLHHYQQRLEETNQTSEGDGPVLPEYEQYRNLSGRLRATERSTLLRLRDENKINDEVLRTLEQELDLLDTHNRSTHA